ncbi:MAG TPA: S41 family peptidase [Candidatus Deferrimicrobium sp.]|nr:S41 family peptidase [Candidatus Deferrimicrobium sp.]
MKRTGCLLILVLALFCFLTSQTGDTKENGDTWTNQLSKYSHIYAAVKTYYPKKFDKENLVFSSIDGLLKELDPHSYFLDTISQRSLNEEQQGNYYGIGTRVSKYENKLTVINVQKETPAYELGIKVGDVIVSIDGQKTKDLSLNQAMIKLRGAKDTYVNVEIAREGITTPVLFRIKRAEIPLGSISFAVMHPEEPCIGYISIRNFGNTTAKEFGEKTAELINKYNLKAMIIDLRGNAGGSLYAAVDIADFFLPNGTMIVSIKGRQLKQNFIARKDNQYENLPLAILINRGSASASEIVASALQEHKKAIIIGSRSWGKGLVQILHKLAFSSSLALTTAKYYTPLSKCLQRDYRKQDDYLSILYYKDYDTDQSIQGGVTPDILVEDKVNPELLVNFISKGVLFKFSRELIAGGMKIEENFTADDTVIEKFKAFLDENNIAYNAEEFKKEIENVRLEIARDVLTNKFSAEKGLAILLKSDPVTRKAVAQLKLKLQNKVK